MDWHHFVGIAGATTLLGSWRAWKSHRNGLPDEERALIYWNDERYERLQRGITIGLWVFAGVLAITVVVIFTLMYLDGDGLFAG